MALSLQSNFAGGVSTSRVPLIHLAVSLRGSWKSCRNIDSLLPERTKVFFLLHAAMTGLHFSAHVLFCSPRLSRSLSLFRWQSCSISTHSSSINPFLNLLFLYCGCRVTNRFFACHTNWTPRWSWYTEAKRFPGGRKKKTFRILVVTMRYNLSSPVFQMMSQILTGDPALLHEVSPIFSRYVGRIEVN